jgi:hypothetical protein
MISVAGGGPDFLKRRQAARESNRAAAVRLGRKREKARRADVPDDAANE